MSDRDGPVTYWCELAWLGGQTAEPAVAVEVTASWITRVRPHVDPPADAIVLPGLTLPGLANTHSHAFHRALRGRTHRGSGSFWTWRNQMYDVAEQLDPDRYLALATAAFGEMVLAGYTAVGEFHYVHHQPDGRPYDDPNTMADVLFEAAAAAGIRITLLDACYLHAGIGRVPEGVQHRFADGDADAWAARFEALVAAHAGGSGRIGAAVHSVRACAPDEMRVVAATARRHGVPLHVHASEQPAENDACVAAYARSPIALLDDVGVLGPTTTVVHATHVSDDDCARLGATGTTVCVCPTTERDLADGIAPARRIVDEGAVAGSPPPLAIGSDSHAVIDPFEETRAVELDERLVRLERGVHRIDALLAMASVNGHRALGWDDAGVIRLGARADLVTIGLGSVRLAGTRPDEAMASVVFAASAADVSHVVIDGRVVVREGHHVMLDVPAALASALGALR